MRRRRVEAPGGYNVWPVFTDALSGLVMVLVFLVTVFVIGETWLAREVSGRDDTIESLHAQLARLESRLGLSERRANVAEARAGQAEAVIAERELDLADLRAALALADATRLRQNAELERARHELDAARAQHERARGEAEALGATLAGERESGAQRLASLEAARAASDRRADEAERAGAELAARVGQLTADVERLQRALALGEAERRAAETAHAGALATIREQAAAALEQARTEAAAALATERERSAAALEAERTTAAAVQAEAAQRAAGRELQLEQARHALEAQLARSEAGRATGQAALAERDATVAAQAERIDELDRQVRQRLVERVETLTRYASEFFGRLREVFEGNPDIRVVGDRFVFQSEVLFGSGEAALSEAGKPDLDKFAAVYRQVSERLPPELPVVIEVIGHTDRAPIRASRFRSNWELSTARAQAVVDYLIRQGIPPERLAAVGMGEFHPVETTDTPDAYRRNPRIELKITNR